MAFDVHETRASDPQGSIRLIDLTTEEQEAPFAVREADGSAVAVSGRIPDRAEILAWLETHPVLVGVATGVVCFSIIAGAISAVLGSDPRTDTDDPAASAAPSEDDGQGSFSSNGSGGANFTSDDSKLSRAGAGKDVDQPADGETATGPAGNTDRPSAGNPQSTDPMAAGTSNLDQSATLKGRSPAIGSGPAQATRPGQAAGPGSSNTGLAGSNPSLSPNSSLSSNSSATPTTAGNPVVTLNPGPNVSGPVPTTATTTRASSAPAANPTTVTNGGQATSPPQPSVPTTPTTPTASAPTTPTTPAPVAISIASPGNGSSHSYETPTSFAVNFVPGATEYCWTFIQSGVTAIERCSAATTFQLPARPGELDPGLVTVRATAHGPFGSRTDTIQISLYRAKVINNPTRDIEIGRAPLRLGVVNLVGATQYCFLLTQSLYDSGALCYGTPGTTFDRNDPIWDFLAPGPLTVTATIYGGGTVLAVDSVTIQLL